MEIKGLYSLRGYLKENFRDTVYEWEDDINNILFCGNGIELVEYQRFEKIRKKNSQSTIIWTIKKKCKSDGFLHEFL